MISSAFSAKSKKKQDGEEPSSDPFGDSGDDSFLVRCSQAADRCGAGAEAPSSSGCDKKRRSRSKAEKETFSDADDSFDMLLTQMDAGALRQDPQLDSSSLKRFHSAVVSPPPPSSQGMSRVRSTPAALPPSSSSSSLPGGRPGGAAEGGSQRSRQEIERKRLEAIRLRREKEAAKLKRAASATTTMCLRRK